MNHRRRSILAIGAIALSGAGSLAGARDALPEVTVYKSPTCGCRIDRIAHLRASGFRACIKARAQAGALDYVFWTTMLGNFEVMSFCDSAMRTAQRRATCL